MRARQTPTPPRAARSPNEAPRAQAASQHREAPAPQAHTANKLIERDAYVLKAAPGVRMTIVANGRSVQVSCEHAATYAKALAE